jgi:hypothetical protein
VKGNSSKRSPNEKARLNLPKSTESLSGRLLVPVCYLTATGTSSYGVLKQQKSSQGFAPKIKAVHGTLKKRKYNTLKQILEHNRRRLLPLGIRLEKDVLLGTYVEPCVREHTLVY